MSAMLPSRAVARSARGVVASPHASASAVGVGVLRAGGNAVDAAIATNAVLAVLYPASCGIGGDAMWMVYEPRTGEAIAYNGSGRASRALEAAAVRERGIATMPVRGALTVTVPGAVRSWEFVAGAHGRKGLDELLAPAEAFARDGFAVTDVVAESFARNEALLRADPEAAALFFARGVPRAGDVLPNPALADVLHAIRRFGSNAVYEGPVAEAIVRTVGRGGNPMTLDDLAAARTQPCAPERLRWRGAEVLAMPPNSQGALALLALGALGDETLADAAAWHHAAIEAIKLAFDARDEHFAEPNRMRTSVSEMLSAESLARMRGRIDPKRARARAGRVDRGGTIALVAVDDEGRAVSLIESLYMGFGSGLVADGTGIVLHNRGAYFSLELEHPNTLTGGSRPLHTLSPGMLLRDGVPELVYGTMGGDGQVQTHVQLLRNIYDLGMNVQEAIDAPRFVSQRPDGATAERVCVESRMAAEVLNGLRERAHELLVLGPYDALLGHASAIAFDRARGSLAGGSDPRADSAALGL